VVFGCETMLMQSLKIYEELKRRKHPMGSGGDLSIF